MGLRPATAISMLVPQQVPITVARSLVFVGIRVAGQPDLTFTLKRNRCISSTRLKVPVLIS